LPANFSGFYPSDLQNKFQSKHVDERDQADLFDSDQVGQQGSQNGS